MIPEIISLTEAEPLQAKTSIKIRHNVIIKKWEICNQKVRKRLTSKGKRLAKG